MISICRRSVRSDKPFIPRQDGNSRLRWRLPILKHNVQNRDPLGAQQAVDPLATGNGDLRRRLISSTANDWKERRNQAPTQGGNDIRGSRERKNQTTTKDAIAAAVPTPRSGAKAQPGN